MSWWRRKPQPEQSQTEQSQTEQSQRKEIVVEVELPAADIARLRYHSLRERLGDYHPDTLAAARDVARALGASAQTLDEAVEIYLDLIRILWDDPGPDDPWCLQVVHEAAELVLLTGQVARAEEMFQHALSGRERVLGRDHPDTLRSAQDLARVLKTLGRVGESVALHHDVDDRRRRSSGPDHEQTRSNRVDLALSLMAGGRLDEAEAEFRALLADAQRVYGPVHERTLTSKVNLGGLLFNRGRLEEAAAMFREALAGYGSDTDDGAVRNNLATVLYHLGRFAEAEEHLRPALASRESRLGPRHPETMGTAENLARVLAKTGQPQEARRLAQRCLEFYTENYPPTHSKIRQVRELLAEL